MPMKVGHGTQKVKKVTKFEMSHRSIETHCRRFQCSMVKTHRVIEQKHTNVSLATVVTWTVVGLESLRSGKVNHLLYCSQVCAHHMPNNHVHHPP